MAIEFNILSKHDLIEYEQYMFSVQTHDSWTFLIERRQNYRNMKVKIP